MCKGLRWIRETAAGGRPRRKHSPFRLARFLDWSCDAGLMRFSGPAYQFRHRELQLWLAAHPYPAA